jgi:hypothetical protein
MTSYPLMDLFLSWTRIIMSIKFFTILSCIFSSILLSDFPPPTIIGGAVMFIHVLMFYSDIYLSSILILTPQSKQTMKCLNFISLKNVTANVEIVSSS